MPRVFIPTALRLTTGGKDVVEVEGHTVRAIIASLEPIYPKLHEQLCEGDALRTGLAVIVDGTVAPLGMLQPVQENSEVHFLPAIGGGKGIENADRRTGNSARGMTTNDGPSNQRVQIIKRTPPRSPRS